MRERPYGSYPVTTWAVLWPLTKRARGDMSKWTGYARHFESCLHYLNGRCWIPAVMCERLAHTGHAMIAAILADMRKQTSVSGLPPFLRVPKTNDWWYFMGYKNSPMDRMFATFGNMVWDGALPRPDLALEPDTFADANREALDEEESDLLRQEAQGGPLPTGTGPEHRLRWKPDNTVRARAERVGTRPSPSAREHSQHRHDRGRDHSDRHRDSDREVSEVSE